MSNNPTTPAGFTVYTHALSPFGMKVYWALVFKQVSFALRYVHPRTQAEIAFTRQPRVPVLSVGDKWKQDSGETCRWLEQLCPNPPFGGATPAQSEAIREADDWVTRNIIAMRFRRLIDQETRSEARKDGRKYCDIMCMTSGGVPFPWAARHLWPELLRRTPFVRQLVGMTDMSKSVATLERELAQELDDKIAETGFLAQTETPSYADIAAFAQIYAQHQLDLSGGIDMARRPHVREWFARLTQLLCAGSRPQLIPQIS